MGTKLIQDPRSYIQLRPLPIPSQRGLKIQARNESVYNPCTPTREQVRRENFQRRQLQSSSQGYHSPNYKPYQGIGYPLYLDQKAIILNTLGELKDTEQTSTERNLAKAHFAPTVSLHLRQPKKKVRRIDTLEEADTELRTFKKAIARDRNLVRNVGLGHGLFELMEKEQILEEMRQAAAIKARRVILMPAVIDYSSDEENLQPSDSLHPSSINTNISEPDFRTLEQTSHYSRVMSALHDDESKNTPMRPFTPKYNNVLTSKEFQDCCRFAIFRQLCALLWILEAMDILNPSTTMSPICRSWIMKEQDIGGHQISPKKAMRERLVETKWNNFTSNAPAKTARKSNLGRHRGRRSLHSSLLQRQLSSSTISSSSTLGTEASHVTHRLDNSLLNESYMTSVQEVNEDDNVTERSCVTFTYCDEHYESVKKPSNDTKYEVTKTSHIKEKPSKTRIKPTQKVLDLQSYELKEDVATLMADTKSHLIRPKSSSALVEFQNNLPSSGHVTALKNLCRSFESFKEHSACNLHTVLESVNRSRREVCESKYLAIDTGSRRPDCALRELRTKSALSSQANLRDQQRRHLLFVDWYHELVDYIPEDIASSWYFDLTLKKLKTFSAGERYVMQSVDNFTSALKKLRLWELRNPDVAAAIEFCREKIVKMPVTEYEKWFRETFPDTSVTSNLQTYSKTEM